MNTSYPNLRLWCCHAPWQSRWITLHCSKSPWKTKHETRTHLISVAQSYLCLSQVMTSLARHNSFTDSVEHFGNQCQGTALNAKLSPLTSSLCWGESPAQINNSGQDRLHTSHLNICKQYFFPFFFSENYLWATDFLQPTLKLESFVQDASSLLVISMLIGELVYLFRHNLQHQVLTKTFLHLCDYSCSCHRLSSEELPFGLFTQPHGCGWTEHRGSVVQTITTQPLYEQLFQPFFCLLSRFLTSSSLSITEAFLLGTSS